MGVSPMADHGHDGRATSAGSGKRVPVDMTASVQLPGGPFGPKALVRVA